MTYILFIATYTVIWIIHAIVGSDVELQPQAIKYKLQKTSTGVCITCIFLDNSTTDHCVAIVHE